jgi:hypothetical protein
VKERRKGPIGRAAELAGGVAATVRRLQREREPRILVYDETGYARLVQPNGRGYEGLLETAEGMVALVSQAEAEARPRLARRAEKSDEASSQGESDDEPKGPRAGRTERAAGAKKPRPGRAERAAGAKKPRAGRTERSAGAKKPRPGRADGAGGAKRPRRTRRSNGEDDK